MSDESGNTQEEWRAIPGYEGLYFVSNIGRVRVEPRNKRPSKILKPHITDTGYFRVSLWKDGTVVYRTIHRLVLLAFYGPHPHRPHCNHIDANRQNNRLENLEWCTQMENVHHSTLMAYGCVPKPKELCYVRPPGPGVSHGEAHYAHKLTEVDVREIRNIYASGRVSQDRLAKAYGVAQACVSRILLRVKWKHVA